MHHAGPFIVTTPLRTLIDLAAVVDEGRLEDCLEEASFQHVTDLPTLQRRLDDGLRGNKGAPMLRQLLEIRDPPWKPTESEFETLLFRTLRNAGLPFQLGNTACMRKAGLSAVWTSPSRMPARSSGRQLQMAREPPRVGQRCRQAQHTRAVGMDNPSHDVDRTQAESRPVHRRHRISSAPGMNCGGSKTVSVLKSPKVASGLLAHVRQLPRHRKFQRR
jgi:hypothetical protein